MFSTLPESAARARRSPAGMAWSCLLHAGVVTLVTFVSGVTRDLTSSLPTPTRPDTLIWIATPPGPTRGSGGSRTSLSRPAGPLAPALPAPIDVPTTILPPNPESPGVELIGMSPVVDAGRLLGSRGSGAGGASGSPGVGGPWRTPDRIAAALPDNPRPRYPDVLRASRIEGRVTLDCVVDTTGVIDLSTVRILDSDHAHFTAAVRSVLPHLRFAPAEADGRRVRQWVRIPFQFRLSPSR